MNLKECYEAFGGSYDEVMSRIPKETSVARFLRIFKENGDFSEMLAAVEAKDYEKVFATTHNLKGMAANLSLKDFCSSVSELCEAVRNGEPSVDIKPMVERTKLFYDKTIAAIDKLED